MVPPQVLHDRITAPIQAQIEEFYACGAAILQRWVNRRASPQIQHVCRDDRMVFVRPIGIPWLDDAPPPARADRPRARVTRIAF